MKWQKSVVEESQNLPDQTTSQFPQTDSNMFGVFSLDRFSTRQKAGSID